MYRLADKILNYLEYMTDRYGIYFIIYSLCFLMVVLLIDIFKRLI